jgi:hypothetical protein
LRALLSVCGVTRKVERSCVEEEAGERSGVVDSKRACMQINGRILADLNAEKPIEGRRRRGMAMVDMLRVVEGVGRGKAGGYRWNGRMRGSGQMTIMGPQITADDSSEPSLCMRARLYAALILLSSFCVFIHTIYLLKSLRIGLKKLSRFIITWKRHLQLPLILRLRSAASPLSTRLLCLLSTQIFRNISQDEGGHLTVDGCGSMAMGHARR